MTILLKKYWFKIRFSTCNSSTFCIKSKDFIMYKDVRVFDKANQGQNFVKALIIDMLVFFHRSTFLKHPIESNILCHQLLICLFLLFRFVSHDLIEEQPFKTWTCSKSRP